MKRLLSLILAAVLLISAVPITASAAKGVTIEQKFNLLLDDLNVTEDPTYAGSYYKELAQYPADSPDWVLIHGGAVTIGSAAMYHDLRAVLGNKLVYIWADLAPFPTGFGVYDTKSGAFYDITDAWDMGFDGLKEAWYDLPAKKSDAVNLWRNGNKVAVIGDADIDGELTILDATRIQRFVAELDDPEYFMDIAPNDQLFGYRIKNDVDYDRDGELTVMDATKIQRHIAELPNMIDAKLAWDEHYYAHHDSTDYKTAYLVNSLKEVDLSDSRLTKDINNPDFDAEQKIRDAYDDDFFKDKSLLVLDYSLFSGSISLTFDNVFIDKDGVLNANFSYVRYPNSSYDCAINDRFIVIEVSKAFLDDVRDIKVNVTRIREKHYDSSIVFDNTDRSYSSNQLSYDLITEHDQLDYSNTYHKIFNSSLSDYVYPQDAFREYAYLLIHLPLGSTSYTVDHVEPEIDNDDILTVNLIVKGPEIGNAVVNNRFICVELSKDLLNDSKDCRVAVRYDIDGYNPDTDYEYRAAKHPYLYVENPDEYAVWNTPNAMLISDRSQLDPALKGHQTLLNDYDESFFKHHILLAIHYDYRRNVQFEGVHIYDRSLYVDMLQEGYAEGGVLPDKSPYDLCVEIPSYYKYLVKDRIIRFTHRTIENSLQKNELILSGVNLNDVLSIPYLYGNEGFTAVEFSDPYSANLDRNETFSPLLDAFRANGKASSSGGIAGIIDSPALLIGFEKTGDNPAIGYDDEDGFRYEPCREYQYDLKFFNNNSLVAIAHHGNDYLNTLKINRLYKKGTTLYIDAEMVEPEQNAPREADYVSYVTVPRHLIRNVTDVKLCKRESLPENLETVVGEITRSENREQMSNVILRSSSHTYLTIRNKWTPSECDLSWDRTPLEDPMLNNGEGYVLLIKNHEDLEKYLPGFDKSEAGAGFNDLFFEENALIVMLGQSYDASAQAEMNHLCVINGDTLYLDASVSYQQQAINGTPVAQPTAPLCWSFLQVSQSDVKNVKKIKVWSTKN